MTRNEVKELLPIMQAFAEGKTIEERIIGNDNWIETDEIYGGRNNDYDYRVNYRVKPTPKYRPFKNAEECWAEMLKHTPFGWVESLKSNAMYEIQCLKKGGGGKIYSYDDIFFSNFEEFFKDYKFADGAPFGIVEED